MYITCKLFASREYVSDQHSSHLCSRSSRQDGFYEQSSVQISGFRFIRLSFHADAEARTLLYIFDVDVERQKFRVVRREDSIVVRTRLSGRFLWSKIN